CRIMQSQVPRHLRLAVAVPQDRFRDRSVALVLRLDAVEEPAERRASYVSLPLGDLLEFLPPANAPEQPLDELLGPQQALRDDALVDARFSEPVADEFPVALLRRRALRAELSQHPIGRERRMAFSRAGGAAVAGPFPSAWMVHGLGAYGIQHDIAADFQQIAFFVDEDRLVAALEEMADSAVSAVVGLGIDAV